MIKYVVDKHGKLWNADDPLAPQLAMCPLCGVRECHRCSPLGNAYYALCPGEVHKYNDCRTLDDSADILNILNTRIESFWWHFWGTRKLPPDESADTGDPDDPDDTSVPREPRITTGPVIERIRGMYTLAHLAATGHLDCNDREMGDGWRLSDLTINPRYAYMLLDVQALNERILQGRPQVYIDCTQTIRFKVFIETDRYGRHIKKYKLVDVHIPSEVLYKKVRNVLFEQYVDESGDKKVRRKCERVAIAGKWTCISKGACKCGWGCEAAGWSCDGHLRADILRRSCIYLMPERGQKRV